MNLPRIVIGTSALGNLYEEAPYDQKKGVIQEALECSRRHERIALFDCAGKYGAGLALEKLGRILRDLDADRSIIRISNKLGWRRVPLQTNEPSFEPGVWVNVKHDAVLDISYAGMWRCWQEGNDLLGDGFAADFVSVHDPDEYINAAGAALEVASESDQRLRECTRQQRRMDVLEAYRALFEMKAQGLVTAVGVGCKDPETIRFIAQHYTLDWAMFACSLTPYIHESCTVQLMQQLWEQQNVLIINSAVFNGGFLIGEDYFDYKAVDMNSSPALFAWREVFSQACAAEGVSPVLACIRFAFLVPAVRSVALNTNAPQRMRENFQHVYLTHGGEGGEGGDGGEGKKRCTGVDVASAQRLRRLWQRLKDQNLIHIDIDTGTAAA